MEKLLKEPLVDDGRDPMSNVPTNKFSKQILKSVIGETRANQVLCSMSMTVIPNVGGGSMSAGLADSL